MNNMQSLDVTSIAKQGISTAANYRDCKKDELLLCAGTDEPTSEQVDPGSEEFAAWQEEYNNALNEESTSWSELSERKEGLDKRYYEATQQSLAIAQETRNTYRELAKSEAEEAKENNQDLSAFIYADTAKLEELMNSRPEDINSEEYAAWEEEYNREYIIATVEEHAKALHYEPEVKPDTNLSKIDPSYIKFG